MQKKIIRLVGAFFLGGIIFITTVGAKKKLVSPRNVIEDKALSYDQFLRATYLHAHGDNDGALKSFTEIMRIGQASQYALEPYIQVLFDAEQFPALISVYEKNRKKIDVLMTKNHMTKAFVAQAYLSTGKEPRAKKMFDELVKERSDDVQLCYFIAVGYIKAGRKEAAVSFLQNCVGNPALKNKHYLFHFLLSKSYLELKRPNEAMTSIELSIAQFPKFDRGWLFRAILHEQQGKISEAINGYKRFLDLTGRDQSIEKQLVQLLFGQQRFSEAAGYLQKLSNDSPEYCFDLALVQSKSGSYEEALPTINKVLASNPSHDKAKLLKIEILMNSDRQQEAITTLQSWLKAEPENLGVLHTFFLLRRGGVDAQTLMAALEDVQKEFPDNLSILTALGDLALDANRPDKALVFYHQAAEQTPHKELKSEIVFQRCHIMFLQKDYAQLEAALAKAEEDDCIGHGLLNLRAYYFSQANKNLDVALNDVNQALDLHPGMAAYMHTKACVLSAMEKKGDALQVAQKALSLAPDDQIIRKHVKELEQYATQPSNIIAAGSVGSSR